MRLFCALSTCAPRATAPGYATVATQHMTASTKMFGTESAHKTQANQESGKAHGIYKPAFLKNRSGYFWKKNNQCPQCVTDCIACTGCKDARTIVTDFPWYLCLCLLVTTMHRAETAEPIVMPFGAWTWMGPKNYVLGVGPGPHTERGSFREVEFPGHY